MRVAILISLFSFLAMPCLAADAVSGDSIHVQDGRTVRLCGIKAVGGAAKDTLQSLIGAGGLKLQELGTDRYGRTEAEAYAGTVWLQGEMLRQGLAFVYPPEGTEPRLDEMLKLEAEARRARRGIWNDAAYADVPADNPAAIPLGSFAFVGGKVLKAERVKNTLYLDFGDDWKTDFTIAIASRDLRKFKKAGIDPLDYDKQNIRVRGWVKSDHGPMIAVTDPSQIERLGGNAAKP